MVVRSFSAKEEKNYILLEINPPQEHVLTLRENTNLEEDGTSVKHDRFIQAASQPPPHIHNHNVVLAHYPLPFHYSKLFLEIQNIAFGWFNFFTSKLGHLTCFL